ncbi:MAG TPA: hypothetical protein VF607_05310, partial [Verrucomicrobiae bacterium]
MCKLISWWLVLLGVTANQVYGYVFYWGRPADGSWTDATNWQTNQLVPATSDIVFLDDTLKTNLTVYVTNNVSAAAIYLSANTTVRLVVANYASLTCPLIVVGTNASLVLSNSYLSGGTLINQGGQFVVDAPSLAQITGCAMTNYGTMNLKNGSIYVGGSPGTKVLNYGQCQLGGSANIAGAGGQLATWMNTGTLQKIGITTNSFYDFSLVNSGIIDIQSGTLNLKAPTTNFWAGTYNTAAGATLQIQAGTWSDAGAVFTGTGTNLFAGTTLLLRTNIPGNMKLLGGDIWILGTNFQAAGSITNLAMDGASLRGTNTVSGTLNFSAGSVMERLTITPSGVLNLTNNLLSKFFTGLTLNNQGVVNCGADVSANNSGINNDGTWNFTGDMNVTFGGSGNMASWTNTGSVRKTGGTGNSGLAANFINLPGGLVESQTGRLQLNTATNGLLGGTFNTSGSGVVEIIGGTWSDAGGTISGTGACRFNAGNFGGVLNLKTNILPGLQLLGGTINVTGGTNFQNAGAITNLILDGATLAGNNTVSGGSLTVNAGTVTGKLIIQTNGQLVIASGNNKFLTPLALTNSGTVTISSAGPSTASTVIQNYGDWLLAGDVGVAYGGVGTMAFYNAGNFRKTTGTGTADNTSITFINQTNGVVQVDSGVMKLPANDTNIAGTLRLNGGTLAPGVGGVLTVTGGKLEGAGTVTDINCNGGSLTPGQSGAGLLSFAKGINLTTNVTLNLDGSGPVAGISYDTLSVTGAVNLGNCQLQISALPTVPPGTTFQIINNDGTDPVNGTFAGLPENAVVTVGVQAFRIHYAGGTGNDVTLV